MKFIVYVGGMMQMESVYVICIIWSISHKHGSRTSEIRSHI